MFLQGNGMDRDLYDNSMSSSKLVDQNLRLIKLV
jgi:hypothetical protein